MVVTSTSVQQKTWNNDAYFLILISLLLGRIFYAWWYTVHRFCLDI